jgi:hypothetical protein
VDERRQRDRAQDRKSKRSHRLHTSLKPKNTADSNRKNR